MKMYIVVMLSWFLAVSCIQGCFYWLSSPIRSGVTADQRFTGHWSGQRGCWRVCVMLALK